MNCPKYLLVINQLATNWPSQNSMLAAVQNYELVQSAFYSFASDNHLCNCTIGTGQSTHQRLHREGEIILCQVILGIVQRSLINEACSTSTWPSTDYIDDCRDIAGVVSGYDHQRYIFHIPSPPCKKSEHFFHFGRFGSIVSAQIWQPEETRQYIASLLSPHR